MTLRKVFEPSLLNDGNHEFTLSADCDGSNVRYYRRVPYMVAEPSEWIEVTQADYRYAELQEIMDRMHNGGPAATKAEIEEWEALQ